MKEIGVGIRIEPESGMSFTGIDELNELISRGAVVTSVEPGGAMLRELDGDGDDEDVRLTLSGCEIKVLLDDSSVA